MPAGHSKASARGRSKARHHRGGGKDKTQFVDSSRDHGKPQSVLQEEDQAQDSDDDDEAGCAHCTADCLIIF